MILGIEVLCEGCGTELEITDVITDCLLRVTLKARPCPKCNRPPDCHLSCEDVIKWKKKVIEVSESPCYPKFNVDDSNCQKCIIRDLCIEASK